VKHAKRVRRLESRARFQLCELAEEKRLGLLTF
jgi:hypothetical protein